MCRQSRETPACQGIDLIVRIKHWFPHRSSQLRCIEQPGAEERNQYSLMFSPFLQRECINFAYLSLVWEMENITKESSSVSCDKGPCWEGPAPPFAYLFFSLACFHLLLIFPLLHFLHLLKTERNLSPKTIYLNKVKQPQATHPYTLPKKHQSQASAWSYSKT